LLSAAIAREKNETSGQVEAQPEGTERRSGRGATLDDAVFISRDATVSLFQSVLEEYLEERHSDTIAEPPPADDRRGGADELPAVTSRSLGLIGDDRRILGRFEATDVRWVNSLFAMAVRRARGRHAFNDAPAAPVAVGLRMRLVLVGDWASGLPRAQRVAAEMRKVLDEGLQAGIEQHIVHLGDTYYSGWPPEYKKRFLAYWPVDAAKADAIGSWSLNGNHDMYSGGDGYFEVLLADPRFKRQERSSFFSLRNEHWQVLGLDTAYDDHALRDPQPKWVRESTATGPPNTLLLSHHQLFSTDPEKGGPKLHAALADVLDEGKVTAWLWGHEHRCIVFDPYQGVRFAACVGHGGIPIYAAHDADDLPPSPAHYEYYGSIDTTLERWTRMGFSVLDFDGPSVVARFVDELGEEHYVEAIA
jgi:3',5'-cyclic AMP phosphodiesterase CpdA